MSLTPIPVKNTWQPVGTGIQYTTIDELGAIIAAQLASSISASISFYAQGATTPGAFVTSQFFNTAQGVWYYWDTGTGRYLPITQFVYGDTKTTFVAGDSPTTGWIVCNGRTIASVPNLSARQQAVLQNLFGATGSLPNIQPLQSLAGLPQTGAFSEINNPSALPPVGQIGALPFSSPPAQTEVQSLASNCEILDVSTGTLQAAVASVITASETLLDSLLAGSNSGMITKVFCGYS